MRIVFVSWRDLAHDQAGGSEVLVDRLAVGALDRGHDVTLLAGGPVAARPYEVIDTGSTYGQYARAPLAYLRRVRRRTDVVVDIENGLPFFAPLWRRGPVVCLVHHVHRDQWPLRFPAPLARAGWFLESRAMPALYRRSLFVTVSPSTTTAVAAIGVPPERIRQLPMGIDLPARIHPKATAPLFLALGRLVPHKRVDLLLRAWPRVHGEIGGTLIVAGDGPEAPRLRSLAGPGVEMPGVVSEADKERLLSEAWLFVHAAMHEGWGLVVMEAAAAGTPTLGFDVPGVRDAVVAEQTGELVRTEDELVARWVALTRDRDRLAAMGAAARARAEARPWSAAIDAFLSVLDEAVAG